MVLYPTVSLVSINPEGSHDHTARDARALAQGRLSALLALEVASTGRAAVTRDGAARADPADEYRELTFGARHAFTANCSSWGLRSRSRASPSTWSSGECHLARDGEPSYIITRQILPLWICSLSRPLASTCSTPTS